MAQKAPQKAAYKALVGINYPPNKRVEPGEVVTDLPASAAETLLKVGAIEKVEDN